MAKNLLRFPEGETSLRNQGDTSGHTLLRHPDGSGPFAMSQGWTRKKDGNGGGTQFPGE